MSNKKEIESFSNSQSNNDEIKMKSIPITEQKHARKNMLVHNKQLCSFAAMSKISAYIILLTGFLLVTSCSNFNKVVKKGTPEEKFNAAEAYFNKADYYHALQLYEELIVLYRGNQKIKDIYFHYAYSYYYEKDYELASYHFKYFARTFPNDPKAEESLYLSAMSKYHLSPQFNLDQTSTKNAISDFQVFINQYPESERVNDANRMIDELRKKLVQKDFEIARLYYHTEFYKSAISALEQHIKDYPSTPYNEECLFLIIKANYDYAKKSVINKQAERYKSTIAAYNNYVAKFPEGEHSKEAMRIMRSAKAKLNSSENK
ncbi:MAG: outer membrane protein assembly factor BamD [Bacteroidales bacterium]|nr:outer membrane protein assembly factor BamD [Bacteroidales bacterium]